MFDFHDYVCLAASGGKECMVNMKEKVINVFFAVFGKIANYSTTYSLGGMYTPELPDSLKIVALNKKGRK